MRIRLGYLATALVSFTGVASAVALNHMDRLPALLLIAPGYLVQAWLFETHRALGGFGYQVTMVGVSTLVWTLVILSVVVTVRYILYRLGRHRVAQQVLEAGGAID
jgi:hypothetical protein